MRFQRLWNAFFVLFVYVTTCTADIKQPLRYGALQVRDAAVDDCAKDLDRYRVTDSCSIVLASRTAAKSTVFVTVGGYPRGCNATQPGSSTSSTTSIITTTIPASTTTRTVIVNGTSFTTVSTVSASTSMVTSTLPPATSTATTTAPQSTVTSTEAPTSTTTVTSTATRYTPAPMSKRDVPYWRYVNATAPTSVNVISPTQLRPDCPAVVTTTVYITVSSGASQEYATAPSQAASPPSSANTPVTASSLPPADCTGECAVSRLPSPVKSYPYQVITDACSSILHVPATTIRTVTASSCPSGTGSTRPTTNTTYSTTTYTAPNVTATTTVFQPNQTTTSTTQLPPSTTTATSTPPAVTTTSTITLAPATTTTTLSTSLSTTTTTTTVTSPPLDNCVQGSAFYPQGGFTETWNQNCNMFYSTFFDPERSFFAGTFRDCVQGAVNSEQFGFVLWNKQSGICAEFLTAPPGNGASADRDYDYASFQSADFPN